MQFIYEISIVNFKYMIAKYEPYAIYIKVRQISRYSTFVMLINSIINLKQPSCDPANLQTICLWSVPIFMIR